MKKRDSLLSLSRKTLTFSLKNNQSNKPQKRQGFTIVELLVVIVVIGILAAITIVSYTGISQKAITATLQSDLDGASRQLKLYQVEHSQYPTSFDADNCPNPVDTKYCLNPSSDNTFDRTAYAASVNNSTNPQTFTLDATNTNGTKYRITNDSAPVAVITTGSSYIQTITAASCPTTRTQVQDARDSHTYWVQELADGKCWMLTNLGYAGGGTNTYSDTKTLTNGTGGSSTYAVASYYVTPSTTNFTTEPTVPSALTTGSGQYGYLYNWCAATGGDLASSGCSSTIATPLPVTTASICPSGWRLPTGNGGEFGALNTAINGGSTATDAGLIGTPWLAQRGGNWGSGFGGLGSSGYYWSSTQLSATYAYYLSFNSTYVNPATGFDKSYGYAVRCVAV